MNTNDLINSVRKESNTYGSIPFWSWNDKLEEEELRRQIGRMDDLGMHGFFMHARGGLETEYMSDEWFDCIKACTDEAKKRGMEAWSYDENGWPSGFAGGALLNDSANFAHFLECKTEKDFSKDALAVFVKYGEGYKRVFAPEAGAKEYENITVGTDSSYVDTFDGTVTAKFINETHKKYKDVLDKKDFGGDMPGFFTDEPQYYRYATPWSNTFPKKFKEMFGYEVIDGLIALFKKFPGYEEFRYDYHLMMHRLFIGNFIKPIYDWCEENGCRLTGHGVEEACLNGQMWCCGGIMPFYQYEHIPGMDYLGRSLSKDMAPKQLGSVCEQTGKKKALSEMFACCGWDVTPSELKRIAELQYANGVNLMCQHLYAYSLRGQRKRDYPANYSEHLPWQDNLKDFNNYFMHLGYMLSRGSEDANVLVIHPIRSCYLTYNRAEDYESVKPIEDAFEALSDLLSQNQIGYHYGDETMLAEIGSVKDDTISIGKCTYNCVIIPKSYTIDANTAKLLKEYISNGGKIWLYDKAPDRIDGRHADLSFLKSNIKFADIVKQNTVKVVNEAGDTDPIRVQVRNTEYGKLVYIVNLSDRHFNLKVSVKGVKKMVSLGIGDLSTSELKGSFRCGKYTAEIELGDSEAMILAECNEPAEKPVTVIGKPLYLENKFEFTVLPENTMLLDNASLSKDGGKTWGPELPLMAIKDMLLTEKYKGVLMLKFSFDTEFIPKNLKLVWEPIRASETFINGVKLTPMKEHWPDKGFDMADISENIVKGKNEITFRFDYFQRDYVYYVLYGGVSESLRNCLWFDTEIECMMLRGNFEVGLAEKNAVPGPSSTMIYEGTKFILQPQKKSVNLFDTVNDGYPFFSGKMSVKTVIDYKKGDGTVLTINGRFAVCEVKVGGEYAGKMLFSHKLDLKKFLREGKNEINLTFTSSNRNLLGPHHANEPDPYFVGPFTFSCEKTFKEDGSSEYYVAYRYAFVEFGLTE